MENQKKLELYIYVDGENDIPFCGVDSNEYEAFILKNGDRFVLADGKVFSVRTGNEQIEISSFRYDAIRMGAAPSISFTLMYKDCLDEYWEENIYATFNGERYFLKQTPTSSLNNSDARYKHEVELVSERAILDNVYFYDAIAKDEVPTHDKPISNSTKFVFFGDIHDFSNRLNASLRYSGIDYESVVDEGVSSEEKLVSFEDKFFSNAIQEAYNVYEIPYYFVGKTIHFGWSDDVLLPTFQYGVDNALLSITKNNANYKIVNRVTGKGSTDNIPYYYPNKYPKGQLELQTSGSITSDDIQIVDVDKFNNLSINHTYTNFGDTSLDGRDSNIYIPSREEIIALNDTKTRVEKLYIENNSVDIQIQYDFDFHSYSESDIELSWAFENFLDLVYPMQPNQPYARSINQIEIEVNKVTFINNDEVVPITYETIGEKLNFYSSFTWKEDRANFGKQDNKLRQTGIKITSPNAIGRVSIIIDAKFKTLGNFWEEIIKAFGSRMTPYSDIVFTSNVKLHKTGGWKDENGDSYNLKDYGISFLKEPSYGDSFKYNLIKYINTSTNLMPSIYRETDGKERFYNALNDTYVIPNSVPEETYEFANTFVEGKPKEHTVSFEDIKPTIKEATNELSWIEKNDKGEEVRVYQRIDMFSEFAYDEPDNDETYEDDKDNNNVKYQHSYFFAKLRKLPFNLFDHAIENQPMTFSFTSGDCGACNFKIGVSEGYPQVNTVQVYEEDTYIDGELHKKGTLKRDSEGRVICGVHGEVPAQECQQDTTKEEVWIALMKEEDTYGVLMPNAPDYDENGEKINEGYRPKGCTWDEEKQVYLNDGDTFVILGINLPEEYIFAAEKKLEEELIKYMKENNEDKFQFSISFSRIYFEENRDILEQLNENARINILYNGVRYTLYVRAFSYSMREGEILPEITVELDEALSVNQNALQNAISEVKTEVGRAFNNFDVLALASPHFLRKDIDNEAQGVIDFKKGIKFGEGGKVEILDNNSAKLSIDYLEVTKKATFTSLEVQEKTHVGGQMLVTPAAINCGEVEEFDNYYRCYFQTMGENGDEIFNQFAIGDLAICQSYNTWGSRYYWREVVGVGEYYIDLSKEEGKYDEGSDAPLAGDKIIQLGNRTDITRQAAIAISSYGDNAPSFVMYNGINDFTLVGKDITGVVWNPEKQEPRLYSYGDFFFGDKEKEKDFIAFENKEGEEKKTLHINANVTIEDGSVMASRLDVGNPKEGEVEAFLNGGDFAKDDSDKNCGKLILAAGIPSSEEEGDLEERAKRATTRIYEDGCMYSNNLHLLDGCSIGNDLKINGNAIEFNSYGEEEWLKIGEGSLIVTNKSYNNANQGVVISGCSGYVMRVAANNDSVTVCTSNKDGKDVGLQVSATNANAIQILNGATVGLRTNTRVLTSTGTKDNPNVLSKLDFNILIPDNSSNLYYIELPIQTFDSNLEDGQEYWIETFGADVYVLSTHKIWSHDYGEYKGSSTSEYVSEHEFKAAGVIRFKYYGPFAGEPDGIWTYTWVEER